MSERETLTYDGFGKAVREVATVVHRSGFQPDVVLSIARGGLPFGGCLGYALDVKNAFVVNVEFYTGIDTRLEMPVMLPPTPQAVDLAGMKVLIADDVADTGRTLQLVRDFFAEQVAEARTAVIYEKPQSVISCDYVWKRTDRWINFPWSTLPPVTQEGEKP
ncbi:phosphoribosyltransferase [Enemella evansiae]|uniref:Phosphoribosyltransferase n=1 Tax=Enemella evansiae TaxID=2016499 RepID=A0A255GT54_9ACTN|nr:phosphoribosyltransferase [Enemella evansiae]PFG68724.1 hypothetical protein B0O41_3569 [Propionibacteriaceae bacterium ES.041]OYN93996.1 phosphoribosyltransferase [Enemella evansiae]OYN95281.1 phosphoribosyltransferase [Enemella evansiae]OYO03381.1 phosphoribosyltransferase [Enemella evansiae]OYO09800.1 phosphoribosyltransferase [Enemella evansiae]